MASATDTLTAINEAISIFDFYHHWKSFTPAFEMFQLVNKVRALRWHATYEAQRVR